ncbi:MAG: bifunctional protein folD [Candidatus Xenolissoclinum pacificiensis L6]|uniref:Bifunctional protein FolD n=1 Tax=Candidatus Xenolissoclinum pacificiensis L6 TaxID=1401685 RepID=W2UYT9_9RICK|nr:MAG: bifunctional protein folD [Candidatus Xenolissoclinum pacificiensis L6]
MIVLDGKKYAEQLALQIQQEVKGMKRPPSLKVIIASDDYASGIYVNNKKKKAEQLGFQSEIIKMDPTTVTTESMLDTIHTLNTDPSTDGILVQLPLPQGIDVFQVTQAVAKDKDVDCFNCENTGFLYLGKPKFLPCTPSACLFLIKQVITNLSHTSAVVIGRSDIVGKPLSSMLLQENSTVTTVHSKTDDVRCFTKTADIVVSAVGKPNFIDHTYLKSDAILIDVGINRLNSKLVGDMNFHDIINNSTPKAITPVPGGVGPLTIIFLMLNTLQASYLHNGNTPSNSLLNTLFT